MHNPDYSPTIATGCLQLNSSVLPLDVQFAPQQNRTESSAKLGDLFAQHIQQKQFFYGIELMARSASGSKHLDYSSFGTLLPLFTSVVWLGQDFWQTEPIEAVDSLRLANKLRPHTVVLPHFTCYRNTRQRVEHMLALNYSNILVLRGDLVDGQQEFQHAADLVTQIRKIRADTISIGVGAHPEGHPDAISLDDDMEYLVDKVNRGADFIITQLCYSASHVIQFIKNCRARGITIPIIVGVYVPEDLRTLKRIQSITQVMMSADEMVRYEEFANNSEQFRNFAVQRAVNFISTLLNSDLDIYGIQFFSMNRFSNIQRVIAQLTANNSV